MTGGEVAALLPRYCAIPHDCFSSTVILREPRFSGRPKIPLLVHPNVEAVLPGNMEIMQKRNRRAISCAAVLPLFSFRQLVTLPPKKIYPFSLHREPVDQANGMPQHQNNIPDREDIIAADQGKGHLDIIQFF